MCFVWQSLTQGQSLCGPIRCMCVHKKSLCTMVLTDVLSWDEDVLTGSALWALWLLRTHLDHICLTYTHIFGAIWYVESESLSGWTMMFSVGVSYSKLWKRDEEGCKHCPRQQKNSETNKKRQLVHAGLNETWPIEFIFGIIGQNFQNLW